ncbi:MAG TPA: GNAT family N-acetyltransferase [Bradyrhizobium sp.]|uniref:GNAT family N-acetyltransferase n=1 Tax=Bradyrhizobium sp. TaxID=376 RepID=UPI002B49DCF3|nr:GNAT family N-acetyltransferase [Bradyrhizobium sp.]HKO69985.1 GNAT family N-acetyltransferase [Bradyrhizobium sp.]
MKSSNVRSIQIALEDPGQPEIITLIRAGEQYSAQLYPTESNHHLALDALRDSNVRFFVSRDGGRAVATGALVLHGSWAELKAMWVVPDARGSGVSTAILAALEAEARSEHVSVLRLETGVQNHAALGLYTRAGFTQRGPFYDYQADPLSVFMEKELDPSPF